MSSKLILLLPAILTVELKKTKQSKMLKWHIGSNFTEHILIWTALIGHHLQSHHIALVACLVSQAGQGWACLVLGIVRRLPRSCWERCPAPLGLSWRTRGCQGCPARRRSRAEGLTAGSHLASCGPFTRARVLNPMVLATFQVEKLNSAFLNSLSFEVD